MRLISKIAFDLWHADPQTLKAWNLAQQEGLVPFGSPKHRKVSTLCLRGDIVFAVTHPLLLLLLL